VKTTENSGEEGCGNENVPTRGHLVNWMNWLEEWTDYYREHKTPHVALEINPPLYDWVVRQRNSRDELSVMQVELLNKAGFVWQSEYSVPSEISVEWMHCFQLWEKHFKEYKTPHVLSSNNPPLYDWVWRQRNNRDKLSATQVELLNKAGFVWHSEDSASSELSAAWMNWFEQWKEYYKKYKSPHVIRGQNRPLHGWVVRQRNNRDKLSATQIELLNKAGFIFQSPTGISVEWMALFEQWKDYKEHKTPHRQTLKTTKYQHLYEWVWRQRKNRDKLSTTQVELLNKAGFVWHSAHEVWMDRLEQWKEYYKEHKTPHVKISNGKLYHWVYYQRRHRGKLSATKVELLNKAGFVWGDEEIGRIVGISH